MKNFIKLETNLNNNTIAFTPMVKREKAQPQTQNSNVIYDDYGVYDVYYAMPSMGFSILLIVVGVCFLFMNVFVGAGLIALFFKKKKDYVICSVCKTKNYPPNDNRSHFCRVCGTRLFQIKK